MRAEQYYPTICRFQRSVCLFSLGGFLFYFLWLMSSPTVFSHTLHIELLTLEFPLSNLWPSLFFFSLEQIPFTIQPLFTAS